ncbi:amidase [Nocardiopsis sp. RSe5-2]|uniref:Amidase n=1 Tax=Nocardiopsis endophytica TaxID=3018445 RepID=A0ABT4TWJ0_9ACTN|nr:amidase [Nocardiopsis endophytica]MDA2809064.1 amidase [Nocardiopsis endophytica]
MQPYEMTLASAAEAVRARRLSPVELVDSVLARIDEVEADLGAYVSVTADRARRAAERAEREAADGRPLSPVHGTAVALKDLIDVAGLPTTASSRVRAGHTAAADSAVAERLAEAGTALVGKAHTHEFAYGLTTPQTRNAWDRDRVAGGSSGGSAVAVASGTATFALGTDTGGSIRVPAALNGVVGLKPTFGLVPLRGVTPLSWSLDHVGPITRTVRDAALALSALAPGWAAEADDAPEPGGSAPLKGLRVGVPRNYFFDRVDADVEAAVRRATERLVELGATPVDVEIPMERYVQAAHWGLMVPEAAAYHEPNLRSDPDLYGPDVRALLEAGTAVTAADHLRAQRARTMMARAWARLFTGADLVAAPTVPVTAVRAGQEEVAWPDGTIEGVADAYVRLCAPANLTGGPALTLPVGRDRRGLPIGMQLIGAPGRDGVLLRAGEAYERAEPGAGRAAP